MKTYNKLHQQFFFIPRIWIPTRICIFFHPLRNLFLHYLLEILGKQLFPAVTTLPHITILDKVFVYIRILLCMEKSKSVYKRLMHRLTYLLSEIDFKLENFAVENRIHSISYTYLLYNSQGSRRVLIVLSSNYTCITMHAYYIPTVYYTYL